MGVIKQCFTMIKGVLSHLRHTCVEIYFRVSSGEANDASYTDQIASKLFNIYELLITILNKALPDSFILCKEY